MNKEERLNVITKTIIGIAINVHRALGPRLLESAHDLKVEQQKPLPIIYQGVKLECGYR